MSITNYNWTNQHPRFVADFDGSGRVGVVGIGPDCIWTSTNNGQGGFNDPRFDLVAFEANHGWRDGDHPRFAIDLDGNGHADILGFGDRGIWTAVGNGDGTFRDFTFRMEEMGVQQGWTATFPRFLADLTGDGRPDAIGFGMDGVWTSLNNGDGSFQPARFVTADLGYNSGWRVEQHPRFATDLTGDGKADLIGFGNDGVWVARSNGDGSFQPPQFVLPDFGVNQGWRVELHERLVRDITGNGIPDIIGFGNAGVYVALGNGDGTFQQPTFALDNFGADQGWSTDKHPRLAADLSGFGKGDLMGFGDAGVWIALGNGDGTFQAPQFAVPDLGYDQGWRVVDHPRMLASVYGSGRPDFVGFGDDGIWVVRNLGEGGFAAPSFVLADFGRRSNYDTIVRNEIITDHRAPEKIKHLFVLMLENRSFDHLLGFAGLEGPDAATGQPTKADAFDPATPAMGRDPRRFNTFNGERVFARRGAPDVTVAPGHDFEPVVEQLCGAPAIYHSGDTYPEVNCTGYISNLEKRGGFKGRGGEIMDCFDPDDLPILTTLAREFAVCDRWFSSMPGPTEPNRYFSHACNSGEYDDSPSPAKLVEASNNHWGGVDCGKTIFEACDDEDVDFEIYRGDHFPVAAELEGVSRTFDTHEFGEHFFDDLGDDDLASFVHIEPRYFDSVGDLKDTNFANGDSQHPLGSVAAGEKLIKTVYEAIRNSRYWDSSMLIITYDEHGGFYDHVAPPAAPPAGTTGESHGFKFDHLGPRVPAIIVSPWTAKGVIEHRLLEHCSIVRTVCDLFGVPFIRDGRDLRKICGVGHLAGLASRRMDTPARLPAVVKSKLKSAAPRGGRLRDPDRDGPIIADPDLMLAKTLRSAALSDIELTPNRRNDIYARVTRIRTKEQAARYVEEVERKLDAAERRREPVERRHEPVAHTRRAAQPVE
jgi:phospholipase C